MAKSSRASTVKANNRRLKSKVFGPVESARMERLSAKLLEVAKAPKPTKPEEENEMTIVDEEDAPKADNDAAMDVDSEKPVTSNKRNAKGRIAKRRKNSKIVFPKYKDKSQSKKR